MNCNRRIFFLYLFPLHINKFEIRLDILVVLCVCIFSELFRFYYCLYGFTSCLAFEDVVAPGIEAIQILTIIQCNKIHLIRSFSIVFFLFYFFCYHSVTFFVSIKPLVSFVLPAKQMFKSHKSPTNTQFSISVFPKTSANYLFSPACTQAAA